MLTLSLAGGIFGMLSCLMTARQREIGVCVAPGARRSAVMSLIVGRGMRAALPGAALGLVVALLGSNASGFRAVVSRAIYAALRGEERCG